MVDRPPVKEQEVVDRPPVKEQEVDHPQDKTETSQNKYYLTDDLIDRVLLVELFLIGLLLEIIEARKRG